MSIKEFFSLPLVTFLVHILLITGVFVNIYQLYRIDSIQKQIAQEEFTLLTILQENNSSRNNKDYYNSDIFKEKFAKEENFKKRGETVTDTTLVESQSTNPDYNYIPEEVITQKSNWITWWEYLFSIDD